MRDKESERKKERERALYLVAGVRVCEGERSNVFGAEVQERERERERARETERERQREREMGIDTDRESERERLSEWGNMICAEVCEREIERDTHRN